MTLPFIATTILDEKLAVVAVTDTSAGRFFWCLYGGVLRRFHPIMFVGDYRNA